MSLAEKIISIFDHIVFNNQQMFIHDWLFELIRFFNIYFMFDMS